MPSSLFPNISSITISSPINALDPRPYQSEIYSRAQEKLVHIPLWSRLTTVIACMLLKDVLYRDSPPSPHRFSVFLVDKVPLALQQGAVLYNNVTRNLEVCYGAKVDAWTYDQWKQVFETRDILVMTADILKNLLHWAYAKIEQINLLIFDECHHAKKHHAYAVIMTEFYFGASHDKRPRIFGMTASPFDSLQQSPSGNSAEALEKILDSRICTVANMASLQNFLHRPTEIEREYEVYDPPELFPHHKALDEMCKSFPKIFTKVRNSARTVHEQLGPWCAHHSWGVLLNDLKESPYQLSLRGLTSDDVFTEESSSEIRDIAQYVLEFYNECNVPKFSLSEVSPKVKVLLDILREVYVVDNVTGILFVQRRVTAYALNCLIKDLAERQVSESLRNIKSAILVGHGSSSVPGDIQMNLVNQQKVLARFRNKQLNLLIATSVAEEGLDITSCNVVIRFDLFATPIQYIQSRGRARQQNSKFYLIKEAGNYAHARLINDVKVAEATVREYCFSLPADKKIMLEGSDDDENPVTLTSLRRYDFSSGARLTEFNALELLNMYSQSLPLDKYTSSIPTFTLEGDFLYSVTLPRVSPLKEVIRGSVQDSRKAAKRAAGFAACVRLHQIGELDMHFRPPHIRKLMLNLEIQELEREVTWTSKTEYPVCRPTCWSLRNIGDSGHFYINIISVEKPLQDASYRDLCFLSRSPLPKLPVIELFDGENTGTARITTTEEQVNLTSVQSLQCRDFTLKIFTTVLCREFVTQEETLPFFIVPLKLNNPPFQVDWQLLTACIYNVDSPLPKSLEGDLQDLMVQVLGRDHRRYIIRRICFDLGPFSVPPIGSVEEGYKSVAEYYEKHILRYEIGDTVQPLLEARKICRVINYLYPNGAHRSPVHLSKPCHLIPDTCLLSPIPVSLMRTWLLVPAVYMRLEAYLQTQELALKLKSAIPLELLLASLQPPSANMSTNYERLEFIGDTFLKFVATLFVYTEFPDKHEGILNLYRQKIVCNRNLYLKAIELDIPGYVALNRFPFSRSVISIPGCIVRGYSTVSTKKLGKKTVADIVEALLGAAYVHGQSDEGLKMAKALAIIDTPNVHIHEFFSNIESTPLHFLNSMEQWPQRKKIEETLGYKFRDGNLLRQALTHASLQSAVSDCYQRLEFAGDAVLDLLVVDHICKKFPNESPANLTLLKSALVSNKTLSAICIKAGFQLYMEFMNSTMISDINLYVESLEASREESDSLKYWLDIYAPKFLSDIVESLIGAIFFDSGCRMEAPLLFFQKFHLTFYDPDTIPEIRRHPMTKLMQILDKRCENYQLKKELVKDEEELDEFSCDYMQVSLVVHDTIIHSETSITLKKAKTLLATFVLEQLCENAEYCFEYCDCQRIPTYKPLSDEEDDFVNDF